MFLGVFREGLVSGKGEVIRVNIYIHTFKVSGSDQVDLKEITIAVITL